MPLVYVDFLGIWRYYSIQKLLFELFLYTIWYELEIVHDVCVQCISCLLVNFLFGLVRFMLPNSPSGCCDVKIFALAPRGIAARVFEGHCWNPLILRTHRNLECCTTPENTTRADNLHPKLDQEILAL